MNGFALAGLARGIDSGINTGAKLNAYRDKMRERRALQEAGRSATEARGQAIQGVMDQSGVNYSDQGPVQPGERYEIGGQMYESQDAARKAAEGQVGSSLDFYQKVAVPKVTEFYMKNGDPDKAQAWQTWAEDRERQKGFKDWANAFRAGQMGDWETVGDYVFEQYKNDDDGITPISKSAVKDKEGNITAFEVKLRNDESGEEYTQTIGTNDLLQMGLSNYAPPQQFEKAYAAQQAAMEARREAAKDTLDFNRDVALSDRKFGQTLERDRLNDERSLEGKITLKQLEQSLGGDEKSRQRINMLRNWGYTEEFIRDQIPSIIGIGEYRKRASPEETATQLHKEMVKSDPFIKTGEGDEGSYYSNLPQAEQKRVLREQINMLNQIADEVQQAPGAAGGVINPSGSRSGGNAGGPDTSLFWTPGQ